jgi:hypothetical protein
MAHYAFLDENNIVTEVIVGIDETELIEGLNPEKWYENFRKQFCKRTSYNTRAGQSEREGGVAFRKNYACIGMIYDENRDAFYWPQPPLASWILNEETCQWEPPTPYPTDGLVYRWDEPTITWQEIATLSK